MDTGFQHLTHCYCHESSPRGLGLKPAAASGASCFLAFRGVGHPGCAGLRFKSDLFLMGFSPACPETGVSGKRH
ncbi:hypothetical protein PAMC26510_32850 [Caballeronia sordidicola]|uniref:Uncharacterized protein n=1 Tax=Caballeronia sordidicola TaxID=196367 RepID=A0A242MD56_CABSO|nr:hypothetical protein PAMC26510_32850 [Caballeronia sordidicola]OTP69142.1 hypothetical protein PAMC26577_31590 [Caballeronia sordidicola]